MSSADSDPQKGIFPRPPQSRNTTDFVVIIFVILVATVLLGFTLAIIVGGLLGDDVSAYFAVVTDIMTTLIGALVGFIAGKGQGRTEAAQEQTQIEIARAHRPPSLPKEEEP